MRSKIVIGGTLATVVAGTLLTVTAADADRAANRVTVVERAVSDSGVENQLRAFFVKAPKYMSSARAIA